MIRAAVRATAVSAAGVDPASALISSSAGFTRATSASKSTGALIAARYLKYSGARSAQRSRARRSPRAASSCAWTAAINELTSSGRFRPSAASRRRIVASTSSRPRTSARRARCCPCASIRVENTLYVRSIRRSI